MTSDQPADDSKTLYSDGGDHAGDSSEEKQAPEMAIYTQGASQLEGSTLYDGEMASLRAPSHMHAQTASSDAMQAYLKQEKFNHNKIMLDRCINSTVAIIQDLSQQNDKSHIYYPLERIYNNDNLKLLSNTSQRALQKKNKDISDNDNDDNDQEIVDFQLLTVDIKTGQTDLSSATDLLAQFDDKTIAKLLDQKFSSIVHHLKALKDRIDDTNSKVLVTGDLNSGKSSFCNAILRRNVLPIDQQPCTNVFCELISVDRNFGIEEVHAVPINGEAYNIKDQTTFKRFKLVDLSTLVYQNDLYSILKVYVKDNRSNERSLLKNGVVDIVLIDAPGLNLDSYQTMQLFSTQEEIDLVIFVVNAENHFTLSGREFISSVNKDKRFSFIIVNKFDNINDKERCKQRILDQVGELSQEIHKDSENFVHFISSSRPGTPSGDGPEGDDGPNGNDERNDPDFDHLEASLRNFILDKRSISKLLPAKNYLTKLYTDLLTLVDINDKFYSKNKHQYEVELQKVTPKYEDAVKNSVKVNDKVMKLIDEVSNDVYDHTRKSILSTLDTFENNPSIAKGVSIFNIDQFIQTTKMNIINGILVGVNESEEYSRKLTSDTVDKIRSLGVEALGEDSLPKTKFQPGIMYSHKRDYNLKNRITVQFEIIDLINMDSIKSLFHGAQTLFSLSNWSWSKIMAFPTTATSITSMIILWSPKIITVFSGMGVLVKLPPAVHYTAMAILIGYPTYCLIKDSPRTIHKNITRRIRHGLENDDYVHSNALRVSKECRKVLNYPAKDVSLGLSSLVDREGKLKRELSAKVQAVGINVGFVRQLKSRVRLQSDLLGNFELD